MPKLGQTMEQGTITEWLVAEGQPVRRGQPLFKIESDKAVLDANAPPGSCARSWCRGPRPRLSRGLIARRTRYLRFLGERRRNLPRLPRGPGGTDARGDNVEAVADREGRRVVASRGGGWRGWR